MRVTSFKDVEAYMYSRLVLPFKRLNVSELEVPSPITDKTGREWQFGLYQVEVSGSYRRNYQRTQARRNRNWLIGMRADPEVYSPVIVGEINPRNRWVKLYETPFREAGVVPLLGKMYDVFDRDSFFSKVFIKNASHTITSSPDDLLRQFDRHRVPSLEQNSPYRRTETFIEPERGRYQSDEDMGYDEEDSWDD